MKTVRIINGAYGYKAAGSSFIEVKKVGDVFEETDDKAEMLVELGVGEIIGGQSEAPAKSVKKAVKKK